MACSSSKYCSSGSPYSTNLVLTFKVPTGSFYIDSHTGNEVQAVKEVVVQCNAKGNSRMQDEPGDNATYLKVKGNLVNPRLMPDGIGSDAVADAVYIDPVDGKERVGKFQRIPTVDSRRPQVARAMARAMGDTFEGRLEFK